MSQSLKNELEKVKVELMCAESMFDESDEESIEIAIYNLNLAREKMNLIIKLIKKGD